LIVLIIAYLLEIGEHFLCCLHIVMGAVFVYEILGISSSIPHCMTYLHTHYYKFLII